MSLKERYVRLCNASETWIRQIGRLGLVDDETILEPARGQSAVLVVDGDDIGPDEISQADLSASRDGQLSTFAENANGFARLAADRPSLEAKLAASMKGWKPDYWTDERIDRLRPNVSSTTAPE